LRPEFTRGTSQKRLLQDFLVQALSRRLRLHAQLAAQDPDAALVLAKGRTALPLSHVQTHQRAVDVLAQRIQREKAPRSVNGGLHGPRPGLMPQELREGLPSQLPEPFALGDEPVLEGR